MQFINRIQCLQVGAVDMQVSFQLFTLSGGKSGASCFANAISTGFSPPLRILGGTAAPGAHQ